MKRLFLAGALAMVAIEHTGTVFDTEEACITSLVELESAYAQHLSCDLVTTKALVCETTSDEGARMIVVRACEGSLRVNKMLLQRT